MGLFVERVPRALDPRSSYVKVSMTGLEYWFQIAVIPGLWVSFWELPGWDNIALSVETGF